MRLFILSVLFVSVSLWAEQAQGPVPPAPAQPAVQPQPGPQRVQTPQPGFHPQGMPPMMRPQQDEWTLALDRMRMFPRPNEIPFGQAQISITDIYKLTTDQTAAIQAVNDNYTKALQEKAANWELEQKAVRDEYAAKLIEVLPEAKRASAKKLLDYVHANCMSGAQRRQISNKEQQALQLDQRTPEGRTKFQEWWQADRLKASQQDEESLKAMKAVLDPEDAAKLEETARPRMSQPLPTRPAQPIQPAQPVVLPPPAPNAPANAPVPAPVQPPHAQ